MSNEYGTPDYKRWSKDAANCKRIEQDCSKCIIHKLYGFQPPGTDAYNECQMPKAIENLESRGVKMPEYMKRDPKEVEGHGVAGPAAREKYAEVYSHRTHSIRYNHLPPLRASQRSFPD